MGTGFPVTLQNKSTDSPFMTPFRVLLGEIAMEGGTVGRQQQEKNRLKFAKRIVESTGTRNHETRLQNEKV